MGILNLSQFAHFFPNSFTTLQSLLNSIDSPVWCVGWLMTNQDFIKFLVKKKHMKVEPR